MSGRLMPEHADKESILGKQTRAATDSRKVEEKFHKENFRK